LQIVITRFDVLIKKYYNWAYQISKLNSAMRI
jgi:hypothetical protein